MDYKKLFNYAISTGEVMLRNGAETSRVEDTINHILKTSHLQTVESFVTPTGLFATLDDPTIDFISYIKRVHKREVNLHKVALANDLSRRFCKGQIGIDEAIVKLDEIIKLKPYSPWIINLAKGFGAGAFTVVYGGDIWDMLVACVIGFLLGCTQWVLYQLGAYKFFVDIIGGAVIGLLAILGTQFIPIGNHFDLIVVGGIMPLVPGVAITNAIRDTIQGDFLSGISRTADAFTVAASVAVGVGIVLRVFYMLGGGVL